MNHYIKTLVLLCCTLLVVIGYAQEASESRTTKDHLSSRKGETTLGLGIGLPYGAIGMRLGTNIANGLNLFGGLGYHLSGVGYNVGLLKDFPSTGMTQFYLTGMYGTNAAAKVKGLDDYNEVFTGPTFGLGVKLNSRSKEGNYWDLGLLVPIRSSEYKDVSNAIKNDPRIIDYTEPWPILITIGFNFNL